MRGSEPVYPLLEGCIYCKYDVNTVLQCIVILVYCE